MKFHRILLFVGLLVVCALASGCKDKNAIKDYRVAKTEPESPAPENPIPGGMPAAGASKDTGAPSGNPSLVTEKPPTHWTAQPLSAMRQASYLVKGDAGATADISLVLLAGSAGGPLENVNRWLSQLGKPAITGEELAKTARHINSPLGDVTLVDLEGLPQGGDPEKDGRIIAGILCGDSGSYFFKMRGNAALAESQKEAFVQWIGTVQRSEAGAPSAAIPGALPTSPSCPVVGPTGKAPAAPSAPVAGGIPDSPACPVAGATPGSAVPSPAISGGETATAAEKPQIKWEVAEGWKAVPPTTMRYASFAVAGQDGESADISVSTFGGDGGGDLENVNRWRQQVGLEPIGAGELKGLIVPVTCKDAEILTVDMTGLNARILAGWTRVGGRSWFFKLVGPDRLTAAQKTGFVKFLQSAQFQP